MLHAHDCRTLPGHCFPGRPRTQGRSQILNAGPAGSELPVTASPKPDALPGTALPTELLR
jgi:hypothetical protein